MKDLINKIKTNKKYLIVGLVGVIVGIIGYFTLNNINKKIEIIYKEPFTLEIGEDTNSLVDVKNDKLTVSTKLLDNDNNEVSNIELNKEYKLEVTLTNSKGKESKEIKEGLKVVDTTKPVITVNEKEIKIDLLQKFDVDVKVEDNSREVIRPDIDTSKVEYAKNGEYEVIITAKDKSGNEAKETVKVIVNGDEKSITKEKVEEFTSTTGITIINLPDIQGKEIASTTTGNKNVSVNQNNTNSKQTVNNNTNTAPVKSQEEIARQQAEAQKKAQQDELNRKIKECKDQWGRWTGSECTWDQPAEPKQETPVVAQPEPQPEQPTSSCNVEQLKAEYEAYASEYVNTHPDTSFSGGWNFTQSDGFLEFFLRGGDGRRIGETVRTYDCH